MGSDPAPFFANLFLYFYENKWIRNLQCSNLTKARKFSTVFRFIDDLLAMNDGGEFSRSLHEIYPAELELNKENAGTQQTSYLDLDMVIDEHKFDISLFDKRNAFPFSIIRMPFLSSNIPSKMFHSSFSAEILCTARVSTSIDKFSTTAKALARRAIHQGGKLDRLRNVLGKVFASHLHSFAHLFNDAGRLFEILN